MADDKPPFPDVKDYVRNYTYDKEHKEVYDKLLKAYSVKDRKADNRMHQLSRKKVLNDLDSMAEDIDALEHDDHLYKLLGKVLHKYDDSQVDIHNKNVTDPKKKKFKLNFDELGYKEKAQELVNIYLRNHEGRDIESLINEIKEGNVENVMNSLLDTKHNIYQQKLALHKMEEILPPNKGPDFYFGLANIWASKRQEDYTETDLRNEIGKNRDTFLSKFMTDYMIAKNNAVKKMKPEKKDAKVVPMGSG
jgi:hypothetical protein